MTIETGFLTHMYIHEQDTFFVSPIMYTDKPVTNCCLLDKTVVVSYFYLDRLY